MPATFFCAGLSQMQQSFRIKAEKNIVTNIDRESEEFIVAQLKKFFPSHAVIAEEGSGCDTESDYLWYVDPLDATNNFAHGVPHFCVSIGLFSRSLNKTVLGVIYEPTRKELYYAHAHGGAFLNTKPIHVSSADEISMSLLATGFPYEKENSRTNNLPELNRILPESQCVRRFGSAALDLCYVASGRFEGYWEPALHPWDVCAGSIIVQEAGGKVTAYDGTPFHPEDKQILATNGHIHQQMVQLLKTK